MSALSEYDFELGGVRFGGSRHSGLVVEYFSPGSVEIQTQDALLPGTDTLGMGSDSEKPPTWSWTISALADGSAGAMELMDRLKAAWPARGVRRTPGAVMPLRWAHGGRSGVVYGRPRGWTRSYGGRGMWAGHIAVDCDFQLIDPLIYSDVEESVTLSLVTRSEGGWIWPAVFPIETTASSASFAGNIEVAGALPTPPVIEISGPIAAPWISGPGWRVELDTTLAYDQSLTIDTRPWATTVLRSDGVSFGGALGSTPLADVRLPPGGSQLQFGGIDPTNTATATVRWRATSEGL